MLSSEEEDEGDGADGPGTSEPAQVGEPERSLHVDRWTLGVQPPAESGLLLFTPAKEDNGPGDLLV